MRFRNCLDTRASAVVFGASRKPSTPSPKLLVVGALGKQAKEYIEIVENRMNWPTVAKVDPQLDGVPGCFANLEDAIADDVYDLALVATPHHLHCEQTLFLLHHNIPVIKEKPFAVSHSDARTLRTEAIRNSCPIYVTVQRRYQRKWQFLADQIALAGTPYSFTYQWSLNFPTPSPGWRLHPALVCGGVLMDMGYHALDMMTTLFGSISDATEQRCFAYQRTRACDLEDSAHILLRTSSGVVGTLGLHRHHALRREHLDVVCEDGLVTLDGDVVTRHDRRGHELSNTDFASDKTASIARMLTDYGTRAAQYQVDTADLERHEMLCFWIERMITRTMTYRRIGEVTPTSMQLERA